MKNDSDNLFDTDFLARLERLHLIAKRISGGTVGGTRRSRRLGDGLEFADHRDYAPGDDTRFIDWPYYARMEKLLIRLFHEHSESTVVVALDCSGSMAPGGTSAKFDYARRTAAALTYVAMGALDRVALAAFGGEIGAGDTFHAGRNRGQIAGVLDYLRDLLAGGATDLAGSIKRLSQLARGSGHAGSIAPGAGDSAGTILLISDLLDCPGDLDGALGQLQTSDLAGRRDVTVIHLFSPVDARGEDLAKGPMMFQHAETDRRMPLWLTDEVLEAYRRKWGEFQDHCRKICLSRGATYVSACTDIPFEQLILTTLKRAGVLAQ
ncbi:MAG: DUF58 domain-containing protein [Phycisphaerae bacterium]|nr:DUF58 domain-containing protein [Phycisphaerae bacterium]